MSTEIEAFSENRYTNFTCEYFTVDGDSIYTFNSDNEIIAIINLRKFDWLSISYNED